jgi:hypothetical protein
MIFAISLIATLVGVSMAVTCPRDDSGCVNVVSPCRVTQCDRADVTCCVVNCRAIFLLANGTEYKCGANVPPPAPTCAKPDCTTVRCASTVSENPCANVTCKSNPRLQCCPGCCSSYKFVDASGAEAKCDDSVPPPPPPPPVCPKSDCSTVRCAAPPLDDPCKSAKCAADSTATCCVGCCGQALFLNRKNETVKCDVDAPVPSPVGSCPRRDCSLLDCVAPAESPCRTAKCAAFPNAKCCDACCGVAQFVDEKSNVLDCTVKPTQPVCPKVDCSNLRCPTPAEDPCKSAKCAADSSATCCAGCCGQTTFINAKNEKVDCDAPNPCLTVRCGGDKDGTYKNCVATFGEGNFELVMGRCCYECKPKVSCATVLCADYDTTKAQCQKRFGDKPFEILAPDATRCCYECRESAGVCANLRACASVDDVTKQCEAENGVGKYAISKDQCGCATCQPTAMCETVKCAATAQVKAGCTKQFGEGQFTMTKDACCETCVPTNACRAPIETGPGRAFLPSFGFDNEKKACVKFVYGGVGGNANRFDSEEKCVAACGGGSQQQMTSPSMDTPDDATAVAVTASALVAAVVVAAL